MAVNAIAVRLTESTKTSVIRRSPKYKCQHIHAGRVGSTLRSYKKYAHTHSQMKTGQNYEAFVGNKDSTIRPETKAVDKIKQDSRQVSYSSTT